MSKWVGGVEIVEHQLAVAFNYGEQVIEVMGDASGEASDGFHFL